MRIMRSSKSAFFIVLVVIITGGGLFLARAGRAQSPAPEAPAQAAAPNAPSSLFFSYQGQLLDSGGNPVTGSVPMTFALYTSSTGGTACWTEAHSGSQAVDVQDGLFHVLLGQLTPLNTACLTGDVYLELTVNGERLSPREVMTSVFHAQEASTLPDGAVTQGGLTVNGPLGVNSANIYLGGENQGQVVLRQDGGRTLHLLPWGGPAYDYDQVCIGCGTSAGLIVNGSLGINDDIRIRDFKTTEVSASGTGDLTIPLGRYRIGNGIQIIAQIEGGWAEGGGVYHISAEWNNNPVVIYRGENSISDRLKFYGYVDPNDSGHAYLFATWDNQSPDESHVNIVKFRITGYDFDTSNTGSFSNASLLPSILTIQSVTGNVGIGTTSPSAMLDVNGPARVGGYFHLGDTDFIMDEVSGRGGGRALVNYTNDTLVINYAGDFTGGVRMDSNLSMNGHGITNCGGIVEANLQTPEEVAAGEIERFELGDVLCMSAETERLEQCTAANTRAIVAVANEKGQPFVFGAEQIKVLGPVQVGDLLVASDVPGYAMVNNDPAPGTVIAKAMQNFNGEQGLILAMIDGQ